MRPVRFARYSSTARAHKIEAHRVHSYLEKMLFRGFFEPSHARLGEHGPFQHIFQIEQPYSLDFRLSTMSMRASLGRMTSMTTAVNTMVRTKAMTKLSQ